jgi:glucuronoarabinoxylan endo-1,4-beta-xylanase
MQGLTRTSLAFVAAVSWSLASCSNSTDNGGSGGVRALGGTTEGQLSGSGGQPGSAGASSSGGGVEQGGSSAGQPGSGGAVSGGSRTQKSSSAGGTTAPPSTSTQAGSGGTTTSGSRSGSGGVSGPGGKSGGSTGAGGATGTTATSTSTTPAPDGGVVLNPTACSTGTAQSSDVTVNLSGVQQRMTGFGVSSAWAGSYRNASDADYLWSTTKGAGLTLLRIRYGDGLAIAKSAASMGVTVWMCPWGMGNNGSPGGPYTTSQTDPNGCKGKGAMPVLSDAKGWAAQLVTWVQNAKNQGVPIYAVSAENEPDSCGINNTTSYSPAQMVEWLKVLGPAMKALNIKVMAPETMNVCGFTGFWNAIKADTAAWDAVDIFASHEYGCGTLPSQPSIAEAGKEYWETEVDTGTGGDSSGDGIAAALPMATTLHNDVTKANLNAWHIWWLYNASGNGGCLYDTTNNVWTKRLWVLGNYSRFVRPGFVRVSTSGTVPSKVFVSAYKSPADGTVAVVAINTNTTATPLSLYISGVVPCSITPWVTSAADNLASKAAITVSNARFTATLDAQSVTTFVGKP